MATMDASGLHPTGEYIRRRQAIIAEEVACRYIYEICVKAERMPGTIRMVRLWDQDVVNDPEQ